MAFETKPISFKEFMDLVKQYNHNANLKMIAKAYKLAKKAHKGQMRKSGAEYLIHPVEVARILLTFKADSATICASLLHDVVEDTAYSLEYIEKEFNKSVAELVDGVTKIQDKQYDSKEEWKAENLRKILLATTKDVRVILIRLADRLHNMRTLATFREDKRRRISKETLEIYAPIAHKLGMWKVKGELEDLSLRYLEPETYIRLKGEITGTRAQRELVTQRVVELIRNSLQLKQIGADVFGRAKYFYSIYKKMILKQKDFDQIYDLIAIRIIVDSVEDCYKVLEVVHTIFEPQLDRFKDYVQHPKANGYQSIHTSVKYEKKILEVQIRTKDMHAIAEEGIAAHWKYKEAEKDRAFDRKIIWLKQILEWLNKSSNAKDFVETLKIDLFENEIIVLTPKGDPISLPNGATPVDFAYMVHSGVGDKCSKAKVNGRIEPLDHILNSGDVVEIITQNNARPSRNWLHFVVTNKARSKIRTALGIEADHRPKDDRKKYQKEPHLALQNYIKIDGKKSPLKISGCCDIKLGDNIVGFYTKDGRISVHKIDCINVHTFDNDKKVELSWIPPEVTKKIRVFVDERPRILADLLNLLATEKVEVLTVNTRVRKKTIMLNFKVGSDTDLKDIADKLMKVKDVRDVKYS